MNDFKEKRESAIKRKEDSDKRQNNKQHCTKIAQGLQELKQHSSTRAIWELAQNARDLSENCHISISLDKEYFTFAHNGAPFTPDSLNSLIKQVSSEEKESPGKVGQYGTGFLTTHSIGRIIHIEGSFQMEPGYYVDLNDFEIDRTFEDIPEFIDKLTNQLDCVDTLMSEGEITRSLRETTKLKYVLTEEFHDIATNGISEAKKLMPFAMVLNDHIKSCTIDDNLGNIHIKYEKEEMPDCGELKVMRITLNEHNKISFADYYYLESEDGSNKIILPLLSPTEATDFDGIAKLFFYFPLLGSENFGVNYIFHSKNFTPLEARNGIFLPKSNIHNKKAYDNNVEILADMTDMLFEYLKENIGKIDNAKYLSQITFSRDSEEELTNNFFASMQERWVSFFEEQEIIDYKPGEKYSISKQSNLKVFDSELTRMLESYGSEGCLDAIYNIAVSKERYILPQKNDCLAWSKIIIDWNSDRNDYFINIEDIVKEVDSMDNLRPLLLLLKEHNRTDLFNSYQLIPNREGVLNMANRLYNGAEITSDLYNLAKEIIPYSMNSLVKEEFSTITPLAEYTREQLRNSMSAKISEIRKESLDKSDEINSEIKSAFIKYCCAYPTQNGNSNRNKIMPIISRLCDSTYVETYIKSLSSDEVDLYELAFNLLVENEMLSISKYETKRAISAKENILNFVMAAFDVKHFREKYMEKYSIFFNQKGELCKGKDLQKNKGIDSDLENIYKDVVCKDLRELWVDCDFETCWNFEESTPAGVAKEIEDKLEEDKYTGKETIDIINKLDEGKWSGLFKYIEKNKEEIFYTRVQGRNKQSIYKIMKISDEKKLSRLAELSEHPNLEELLNKIETQIQQEKRKREDFDKKYEIGKRIEALIKERISDELNERVAVKTPEKYNSTWEVDDIQNGQDIIISYDGLDILYIEVKSKWNFNEAAHMSKNQMRMAIKNSDKYALCCVDLTECNIGDRLYPDIDVVLKNIYIHMNIGDQLKPLMGGVISADEDISESKIGLDGDYMARIRKSVFKSGKPLSTLIDWVVDKVEQSN